MDTVAVCSNGPTLTVWRWTEISRKSSELARHCPLSRVVANERTDLEEREREREREREGGRKEAFN